MLSDSPLKLTLTKKQSKLIESIMNHIYTLKRIKAKGQGGRLSHKYTNIAVGRTISKLDFSDNICSS